MMVTSGQVRQWRRQRTLSNVGWKRVRRSPTVVDRDVLGDLACLLGMVAMM